MPLLLKEDNHDPSTIRVMEDWKVLAVIFALQLASLTFAVISIVSSVK